MLEKISLTSFKRCFIGFRLQLKLTKHWMMGMRIFSSEVHHHHTWFIVQESLMVRGHWPRTHNILHEKNHGKWRKNVTHRRSRPQYIKYILGVTLKIKIYTQLTYLRLFTLINNCMPIWTINFKFEDMKRRKKIITCKVQVQRHVRENSSGKICRNIDTKCNTQFRIISILLPFDRWNIKPTMGKFARKQPN